MVEPNKEDMERAKIVLDDTLPYELDMLDSAAVHANGRILEIDEAQNRDRVAHLQRHYRVLLDARPLPHGLL